MGSRSQKLFHFAARGVVMFSALVLVACVLLWAISSHCVRVVRWESPAHLRYAGIAAGRLVLARTDPARQPGLFLGAAPASAGPADWSYFTWYSRTSGPWEVLQGSDPADHRYLGVEVRQVRYPVPVLFVRIPFLYLTLLASILPALGLWRRRQQHLARERLVSQERRFSPR